MQEKVEFNGEGFVFEFPEGPKYVFNFSFHVISGLVFFFFFK